MSDDLQDSWNRMVGNKPARSGVHWLLFGMVLGILVQVGPGALAGLLGWSAWWAVAWGVVLSFHSTIVKSNIGRGILSGSLPPHWLSAVVIMFPLSAALFSAMNFAAYWLVGWLLR